MTLDEAIEILTIHNDHNPDYTDQDRRDAHQLGIEALKRVKWHNQQHLGGFYEPLPGETK